MAYNEYLAERILQTFKDKGVDAVEKKMMGGITFMVNEKMCAGVIKDMLMARLDPDIYQEALKKKGCKPMDFTGRPMKGYVYVEPEAIDMEEDLAEWIQLCIDYNPKAKSSRKRK